MVKNSVIQVHENPAVTEDAWLLDKETNILHVHSIYAFIFKTFGVNNDTLVDVYRVAMARVNQKINQTYEDCMRRPLGIGEDHSS
jgi:hypothetical protein